MGSRGEDVAGAARSLKGSWVAMNEEALRMACELPADCLNESPNHDVVETASNLRPASVSASVCACACACRMCMCRPLRCMYGSVWCWLHDRRPSRGCWTILVRPLVGDEKWTQKRRCWCLRGPLVAAGDLCVCWTWRQVLLVRSFLPLPCLALPRSFPSHLHARRYAELISRSRTASACRRVQLSEQAFHDSGRCVLASSQTTSPSPSPSHHIASHRIGIAPIRPAAISRF